MSSYEIGAIIQIAPILFQGAKKEESLWSLRLADNTAAADAKQLGIAYYDDMLLKEAAEESGLCEELFRSFDERPKSFLYSIAMDPYSFSMNHVTPKGSIEQQVYLATYDTIKKLADKGPCVLIGRCADYALKDRDDVINLFITAPLERPHQEDG